MMQVNVQNVITIIDGEIEEIAETSASWIMAY
jgi:hypothetical protein